MSRFCPPKNIDVSTRICKLYLRNVHAVKQIPIFPKFSNMGKGKERKGRERKGRGDLKSFLSWKPQQRQ